MVKNLPANEGDAGSIPGSGRSPGGEMATTPVLLPGESHGQRSPLSYSSWGLKELNTTELLHKHVPYTPDAWSTHTPKSLHTLPAIPGDKFTLSENRCLNGMGQPFIKPKDRRQGSVISYLCEKDWEPTTRVMSEESSSVQETHTQVRALCVETPVYFLKNHKNLSLFS